MTQNVTLSGEPNQAAWIGQAAASQLSCASQGFHSAMRVGKTGKEDRPARLPLWVQWPENTGLGRD